MTESAPRKLEDALNYMLANHFKDLSKLDISIEHVSTPHLAKGLQYGLLLLISTKRHKIYYGSGWEEISDDVGKGIVAHEMGHIVQGSSRYWRLLDKSFFRLLRNNERLNEFYHRGVPTQKHHRHSAYAFEELPDSEKKEKLDRGEWMERNADLIAFRRGCQDYLRATWKHIEKVHEQLNGKPFEN